MKTNYTISAAIIVLTMAFAFPLRAEVTAAPAGYEPVVALLATANVSNGEKLSHTCAACHSFDNGGAKKLGPNLYNIVNKAPAQMDGFAYSDAMKSIKDKKWTYEALDLFLFDPKGYLAGTKMPFAGIKKTQDRADLIAWLRTLSDKPVALAKTTKK